jgi:DNA uptake protein ComE-like DNA-binding protein
MNWKAYFFFTKGERRGVIALLLIASLFLLVRVLLANRYEGSSADAVEEPFVSSAESRGRSLSLSKGPMGADDVSGRSLSPMSEDGAFGRSLSLSKGPTSETREFKHSTRTSRRSAKTDEMVELNSADTTRLKMLRGIGSGYAKMIVAYREKLGGFYATSQLLEVYKFPDETYQKIKHQLSVDTTLIRKIKVNEATVKELKFHPYISYYQALSIVENRELQPAMRYNSLYDMVVDEDLKEEDILRVAPYFSFE